MMQQIDDVTVHATSLVCDDTPKHAWWQQRVAVVNFHALAVGLVDSIGFSCSHATPWFYHAKVHMKIKIHRLRLWGVAS